jgi:hypothetical protein
LFVWKKKKENKKNVMRRMLPEQSVWGGYREHPFPSDDTASSRGNG